MRAYLVCGPESSGNCYLTRLLVEAGCVGRGAGVQPFDGPGYSIEIPHPRPERIAIVRSLPHAGIWLDIEEQIRQLYHQGYRTTILVPIRDQYSQERSQLAAQHAHCRRDYLANQCRAYGIICDILSAGFDFLFVPYACLGRPDYRVWLRDYLQLPGEFIEPFTDGDTKYATRHA